MGVAALATLLMTIIMFCYVVAWRRGSCHPTATVLARHRWEVFSFYDGQ